mmetsp:Transcript_11065/g.12662  ORF Transcript_11065/g.12662 Transcript_11065/m.12662 type:complete len:785 (+) Transcript_11065:299-2653(+)|eukprot:CAMPEP_0184023718 /NCGR_PEP_ID=MMETSP0954-20121128/11549_1 /TAXON_ID=627963 /ORGANISM="Aplanochytrium sp, Strain PBS07" /LENGTH=784 /DNA_ID=CAMNT_0026306699 /DNA_START=288 /DNA_END=2642 /DNA_ORIENTATION=+
MDGDKHAIKHQLVQMLQGIIGGFDVVAGVKSQCDFHGKLIKIVLKEIDDPNCPYSSKDLIVLEQRLRLVYDIIIRLQPASPDELVQAMKELRTVLSLGYERQNLSQAMYEVAKGMKSLGMVEKNAKAIESDKLLTEKGLKSAMKRDEAQLVEDLKSRLGAIKELDSSLAAALDNAKKNYETACARMTTIDALDIDEITTFDQFIRGEILKKEADIDANNLHTQTRVVADGVFGPVLNAEYYHEMQQRDVSTQSFFYHDELLKDEFVELTNEMAMWKEINNDTILRFFGICIKKDRVYLVSDYTQFDLFDILHKRRINLDRDMRARITKDVSLGLLQLHSLNIIHRNIRPSNIVFGVEGLNGRAKLTNFGNGIMKYDTNKNGPNTYTAPEVLRDGQWSNAADVYALALVMWEMGQNDIIPFQGQQYNLHQAVAEDGDRPNLLDGDFDNWMRELILTCWHQDPALRPTMQKVCGTLVDGREATNPGSRGRRRSSIQMVNQQVMQFPGAQNNNDTTSVRSSVISVHRPAAPSRMGDKALKEYQFQGMKNIREGRPTISGTASTPYAGIQAVIAQCSKPRKVNKRLKQLPEEAMLADRLDMDTLFFYFWLKKLSTVDCEVISKLMMTNKTWLRISLEYNNLDNEAVDFLAEGLRHHKSLVQLFLGNNKNITNCQELCDVLSSNTNLEVLSFKGCSIGDLGAHNLAEMLKNNEGLVQLDVSQNNIGNEGFSRLAKAIPKTYCFESIIVWGQDKKNKKEKGLKALKKAVKEHNSTSPQRKILVNRPVIQT